MEDGSKVYMEQISHHPPVSYMLTIGPGKNYRWYGYSEYKPNAHMNSIELNVLGKKCVDFPDGSSIEYNPTCDRI
jgi:hypothetical protein